LEKLAVFVQALFIMADRSEIYSSRFMIWLNFHLKTSRLIFLILNLHFLIFRGWITTDYRKCKIKSFSIFMCQCLGTRTN